MLKQARAGSIIVLLFLVSGLFQPAIAAPGDKYLQGYIDAMLRFELGLETVIVTVSDGEVTLDGIGNKDEQKRVKRRLLGIKGVNAVSLVGQEDSKLKKITSRRLLFTPAIADPRSPRFSASWHNYLGNNTLKDRKSVV